jgi:hypothetical protein
MMKEACYSLTSSECGKPFGTIVSGNPSLGRLKSTLLLFYISPFTNNTLWDRNAYNYQGCRQDSPELSDFENKPL